MKYLVFVLVFLLAGLQYRLWVGEGSLAQLVSLKRTMAEQKTEIAALEENNRVLVAEVMALKQSHKMIEEKARTQLGMIKDGETFFMFAR